MAYRNNLASDVTRSAEHFITLAKQVAPEAVNFEISASVFPANPRIDDVIGVKVEGGLHVVRARAFKLIIDGGIERTG
ncbi:hypothetical protein ABE530_18980 [Brucella sp. TWI559]